MSGGEMATRLLVMSAAVAVLAVPGVAQDRPSGDVASDDIYMTITYQAEPANRAEFRRQVETTEVEQFESWMREGMLKGYKLLFNAYTDVDTWDMLAVLQFDDYTQVARWNEIERRNPGGLSQAAGELAAPVNTYLANLRWEGLATENRSVSDAVYFIIPYDYGGQAEYERYAETYVIPQMKGWVDVGTLTGYSIYLNRHPTGKPWDVLFVLEYRDHEAFGNRDNVKWRVRAGLDEEPSWKLVSEIKQDFRYERETVITDRILPSALRAASNTSDGRR